MDKLQIELWHKENQAIVKQLYFDLIIHFLKRKDYKTADQLKAGWEVIHRVWY